MTARPIALIVAMAENRVIGLNNQLPWRIKEDMAFFKRTTMGKPMIMGRKTFESIGKPLPGRTTVVITRNADWHREGVQTACSVDEAIRVANRLINETGGTEIIVAGGAEIYAQTLDRAERLYITEIAASPDGDACFPEFDRGIFREVARDTRSDHDPAYAFVTLTRRGIS